eukprot:jgi/Psemu1/9872/gm1.9872_g
MAEEEPGEPEEELSEIKMIMEKEKARSVIHGQCTKATMIQKLTADTTSEAIHDKAGAMVILKLIKKTCYKFEAQQFPALAAVSAATALCKTKQGDLTTNIKWLEQFDNLSTMAEACGATAKLPGITEYIMARDYNGIEVEDLTDIQLSDVKTKTTNMTLATIYIKNSNLG